MSSQPEVRPNRRGLGELLRSEQMRAHLFSRARRVQQAAQAAVDADERAFIDAGSFIGRRRARATVMYRGGLRHELAHRMLGRSIDAARGS